ncbi:hypothetical protein AKJ09_00284 [Labilithrix luteola]|uniref:Uncharacterized protein n=1 Tax=Labilithrix luteola TaxID=1391654 RepID=A0A0K1PJC0_9BACT|nr:SRPBCC family protein [Labilithrix luteola]AKU93620.1 hypothetical protein AKJ09_00284 [Labilithrix luteola]
MIRLNAKLPTLIALLCSLAAAAGCAVEPTSDEASVASTSEALTADESVVERKTTDDGVELVTTELGPHQYRIVTSATFDRPVARVWPTFLDFQNLVELGLPGSASDFVWVDGGSPQKVPSSFQFISGGETIHEEVYYRDNHTHTMRYRLLQPALGFVEIDSVLQLENVRGRAHYTATRVVTLDPNLPVEALSSLLVLETANLKTYFAKKK